MVAPTGSASAINSERVRSVRQAPVTIRTTSVFAVRKPGWFHSSPASASGLPQTDTKPDHWRGVPTTTRTQPSDAGSTQ